MSRWAHWARHAASGALALLSWLASSPAPAQSLESVLAPGDLIRAHAKWDDDCKQCHVRFDRGAQDRLCMDCHKDVGQDVRAKTGFHGRIKPQACRSCHTDHKGRDAQIAPLDTRQFDHGLTDYALRGQHRSLECAKCHEPAKRYRQAPTECSACHRKDDVHKGSLGLQCAGCHTESRWKEAHFDHDKTRFALSGKHADIKCADCHKGASYKDTPRTCIACHKKDDESKGHQGQFGDKCESCHGTKLWKPSRFNHDTDTRFSLRGRHRTATCSDCHTGPVYKLKLTQACNDCHRKDDKHKGTLGKECASCHTETDWKEKSKFDHDKTSFALLGKHAAAECSACHKSRVFKDAPKACVACHAKDDAHERTLGEQCGDCHHERGWKATAGRFDHARTLFPLRNAHAAATLACTACHRDLRSFRKTPQDCVSCHLQDDKHAGQEGRDCAQCHSDKSWKLAGFDHARTAFALTGRHTVTACKACHATPRFKDAARDCHSCHAKADKHGLRFGTACEGCHNTRAWALWSFDHDRRSAYKLAGAHRKLACESCHTRPAPAGSSAAPLGSNCASCHGADDTHDGRFGARCEQCHVPEKWKQVVIRTGALQ